MAILRWSRLKLFVLLTGRNKPASGSLFINCHVWRGLGPESCSLTTNNLATNNHAIWLPQGFVPVLEDRLELFLFQHRTEFTNVAVVGYFELA